MLIILSDDDDPPSVANGALPLPSTPLPVIAPSLIKQVVDSYQVHDSTSGMSTLGFKDNCPKSVELTNTSHDVGVIPEEPIYISSDDGMPAANESEDDESSVEFVKVVEMKPEVAQVSKNRSKPIRSSRRTSTVPVSTVQTETPARGRRLARSRGPVRSPGLERSHIGNQPSEHAKYCASCHSLAEPKCRSPSPTDVPRWPIRSRGSIEQGLPTSIRPVIGERGYRRNERYDRNNRDKWRVSERHASERYAGEWYDGGGDREWYNRDEWYDRGGRATDSGVPGTFIADNCERDGDYEKYRWSDDDDHEGELTTERRVRRGFQEDVLGPEDGELPHERKSWYGEERQLEKESLGSECTMDDAALPDGAVWPVAFSPSLTDEESPVRPARCFDEPSFAGLKATPRFLNAFSPPPRRFLSARFMLPVLEPRHVRRAMIRAARGTTVLTELQAPHNSLSTETINALFGIQ
ncbi:hypothetical protein GNI_010010 [Gregarina niphandrodes]|uniref:Uncharacterized protein n=1 Tax=Gregarina niphandrodes TaxID=110365 RepID=A0A023BD17_GRENI|nr:hypothetical protein GNI_010010 [Gregarina niphandrodes]EZG86542.1 hypothetical protein GNI_010010 [Gregarina niphandrodes]|eukprot:XP_011128752.1 hypothetical protein GNI_010010 [Gregarina niphandrodes]